jgi:hypothetical protein
MYRSRMHAVLLGLSFLTATAALAQTGEAPRKNEIELVIGATETPSIGQTSGGSINLNSSLALGAEYDRRLLGERTTLYVGVDFLASPVDVKVSYPSSALSPEYAGWALRRAVVPPRRPAKAAASTRLFTLLLFMKSSFRRLGIGLYASGY